mmetsp:Transcript_18729/g.48021  ORF Transcript_18729/g.48021 Transcript_18729/m.48021 type:complete len:204 (-) Transcript_18729:292-903(-)
MGTALYPQSPSCATSLLTSSCGSRSHLLRTTVMGIRAISVATRNRVTCVTSNGGSLAAKTSSTWSTFAMGGSSSSLCRSMTSPTRPLPSCQSMLTTFTRSPTSTRCCIFFSSDLTLHSSDGCGTLPRTSGSSSTVTKLALLVITLPTTSAGISASCPCDSPAWPSRGPDPPSSAFVAALSCDCAAVAQSRLRAWPPAVAPCSE